MLYPSSLFLYPWCNDEFHLQLASSEYGEIPHFALRISKVICRYSLDLAVVKGFV